MTIIPDEPNRVLVVRRQFNDWRKATYSIGEIDGLHFDDISGGIMARTNRAYLHCYVWCDAMLDGELAHSCSHGEGPHRIKVCVVQKDNSKKIYSALLKQMEWEHRLHRCPFMVASPKPIEAMTSQQLSNIDAWLDSRCQRDDYVNLSLPIDDTSKNLQVWFADLRAATEFAEAFDMRLKHHQNQEKQQRTVKQLLAMNI